MSKSAVYLGSPQNVEREIIIEYLQQNGEVIPLNPPSKGETD